MENAESPFIVHKENTPQKHLEHLHKYVAFAESAWSWM